MATVRARICNKKGLHARAAAKVVNAAAGFDAKIQITRLPKADEASADMPSAGATSILSLLMLGAERGAEVELRSEGAQAEEALVALVALIGRKFDEEE